MCEGRRKRVLGEEAPARAGGGHRRFPQGWCPQQGQPPPATPLLCLGPGTLQEEIFPA